MPAIRVQTLQLKTSFTHKMALNSKSTPTSPNFWETPINSYKKGKSLRDLLVRASIHVFTQERNQWDVSLLSFSYLDKKCHEYCRERRRSPDPTPVGSLLIVILAGVGWISWAHRLPWVDDQRMKVQFKMLNEQCKLASEIHKIKCWKQKHDWQMLNIECENLEVQPAELKRELEHCLRKGECTRPKLECCTRKVEWRKCKLGGQTTNVG